MNREKCTAVVLAAGKGSRMGTKIQKQYLEICGKPVLYYSLAAFAAFCTGDAIGGRGDICFWLGVRTAARRVLAWILGRTKKEV